MNRLEDDKKQEHPRKKSRLTTTRTVTLGFVLAILAGSLILTLPISSAKGTWTPYIDALFTSTTSFCVTGLVTVPTFSHWSAFGKVMVALMIQLGGLGIYTAMILTMTFIGKRITLKERVMIQESYNLESPSGMIRLILRIFKGTLIVEGIGAFLFMFRFAPQFGVWKGLGISVFQSISAFCNAGMDIIDEVSLRPYVGDPLVSIVTMLLIIFGGIGYIVWWDILDVWKECRKKKLSFSPVFFFRKLTLHSKVALTTTFFLIVGGAALILCFEWNNPGTMKGLSPGAKVLASFFQSVTTRTAGFESIPQANLTGPSDQISILLMLIGGSPVGTAGGVKTTTFAMLCITIYCTVRGRKNIEAFGRSISMENFRMGLSVIAIFVLTLFTSILLLQITENQSARDLIYEATSAIGTVGLSKGITSSLTVLGKLIIIFTMYAGRVGPITLFLAFMQKRSYAQNHRDLPEKKIVLG